MKLQMNNDIEMFFFFTGTEIVCQARGSPFPKIVWTKTDGTPVNTIPGLRQVGNRLF